MEWWMWCIIAYLVGCSILCGYLGYLEEDPGDVWAFIVFWPIILGACILLTPFMGVWKLGGYIAKRQEERKKFIKRMLNLFAKLDLD